jgi:hypothetical protein
MERYISFLFLICFAWGQSPCDDKLLKELDMKIKDQGLDALSEREWIYYQLKSDECTNEKKVSKTFDTKSSKKERLLNHKLKKYDSNYIAKKTFFTIFIRLTSILIVASLVNLYG